MDNFERKYGKYAVKNLPKILIFCYVLGYLIQLVERMNGLNGVISQFICLNPERIVHGQVWRLFTWVLIPPASFDFFTIIMLLFYYSISKTLESVWGTFRFNIYLFSGMLFTILGSFILMGLLSVCPGLMQYSDSIATEMMVVGVYYFSTYYVNMSIFLAFACTFPDNRVLLMFVIPIKMKWLGIAYGAILVYEAIAGGPYMLVTIVASLLNFLVFFLTFRKKSGKSAKARFEQARRYRNFENDINKAKESSGMSKHRCAICGRTELDNPDLQFRFCSKCNGNYEYCSDHLFSHTHVE